ncbi:MAG: 3-deoxy-7-phosphoheptulonate synthase [Calditrichia bacterium]|nr:3-deoxy-7-phosphoheptulonate synthase [Calditrichia bacterium]
MYQKNPTCDLNHGPIQEDQLKLVSRKRVPEGTVIDVSGIQIGGPEIVIIAGPCSVESEEQLSSTATAVKELGAHILRGGAYKPRTSPYSFQGLQDEGLTLLSWIRDEIDIPVVTEVMDPRKLELVCEHADILQIGSRNMHNTPLLNEVGKVRKPVLLKRGMSATIEEFLYAAEYIIKQGNDQVILCERGIRTFEPSTRFTLDIGAIPVLKRLSHLPVIVDPSHGTGHWWMVPGLAKAAIAAGADGLIIEVHCDPQNALCDGGQSLHPDTFKDLMDELFKVALAVGRSISSSVVIR